MYSEYLNVFSAVLDVQVGCYSSELAGVAINVAVVKTYAISSI